MDSMHKLDESDYGTTSADARPDNRHEQSLQGRVVDHTRHGGTSAHADPLAYERLFRRRFWVCLVLSIPVLLESNVLPLGPDFHMPVFSGVVWLAPLLALAILFYGGIPLLQLAVIELQARRPGTMTLVSLALLLTFGSSAAAFLILTDGGRFGDFVLLVDMILLGQWLEAWSHRLAAGSLEALADLLPATAERVLPSGAVETIRIRQLRPGNIILARPGDAIAADGVVVEGESEVDEAPLTGAAGSVRKEPGSHVLAGTINRSDSIRYTVTAVENGTWLAMMLGLVLDAEKDPSRSQALAGRAAAWLFYLALAVAALAAGLAEGWSAQVTRAAAVLVIASPHALGLAIPLVVAHTAAAGARSGILIRSRRALQAASEVSTVIFKIGPHAPGKQTVEDLHRMSIEVALLSGEGEAEIQAAAAGLGADHYFADVPLQDQPEKVRTLQADGKRVAFAGDGITDAPCFERADVGISMGSGGNAGVEPAGIVLAGSDPQAVVKALALARASEHKMRQNVVWAVAYNALALPLAAGVLAPIGIVVAPALGALLMALSTIVVAVNARLLQRT